MKTPIAVIAFSFFVILICLFPLASESTLQCPTAASQLKDPAVLMAEYYITLSNPSPEEMHNVELAISLLTDTTIEPGQEFSQNQSLGPYTCARGYKEGPVYLGTQLVMAAGGGVCKVASLLYNAAILSNLPIVERHNHSKTVPYVPLGQDATVYYGAKDLRFTNDTPAPITIRASTRGNTLRIAIYGQSKPPIIRWRHEIVRRVEYWTVYRWNPNLPPGREIIILPGQDGYLVRSWLVIEHDDGTSEERDLGNNWYDVLPQVVERG